MPIVAVAGALIAGAIAAPAIGGLITAGALTLGGALEITAALGATLGAVGSITRDKGLMNAGLILGGIGGIGSLASAAGLIDGSTQLFGDAAANATAETTTAGADLVDSLDPESVVNSKLVAEISAAEGPDSAEALAFANAPKMSTAPADLNAAVLGGGDIGSAPAGVAAPTGIKISSKGPAELDAATKTWQLGDQGFPDPSILTNIKNFATSSPLVSYGLIQAGGSLVSGLFSPITPAQVEQMNANAANSRAQAAFTQQQASNIGSGIPGVTRIPQKVQSTVTGAPAPSSLGMINNLPPPPVTGATV